MIFASKRLQSDVSDLKQTLAELQRDFDTLRKAWSDELVDLLDLREQIANHLRRLAGRATMPPEARIPEGGATAGSGLDEVSQRVLERRQHGLRRISG